MAVPGDTTPASRGDPYLDWVHGTAHEHESAILRDGALAKPTCEIVGRGPLMRVATVVAALRVVTVIAFVVLLALGPVLVSGSLLLLLPVGFLFVVLLGLVVFGAARQFLFTCGVVWALHQMDNQSPSAGALMKQALRSGRRLAHLGFGRMATPVRSLYDAVTVFVVPVMLCEGLGYSEARARSEQLVAQRWGPGRFRAHGMPRLAHANIRYAELVEKHGPRGPWRQIWFIPAAVAAGVVAWISLGTSDAGVFAGVGVLMAWALVFMVRSTTAQPVMEGVLRAYLYDYARTGRALAPYEAADLHQCMREELRGMLGLAQRAPGDTATATAPALTPAGYVKDAGVTGQQMVMPLGALPDLVRDNRTVLRAVRALLSAGRRADHASVTAESGLAPERTKAVLDNLVQTKNLLATAHLDGTTTYEPRKKKASWWEKR